MASIRLEFQLTKANVTKALSVAAVAVCLAAAVVSELYFSTQPPKEDPPINNGDPIEPGPDGVYRVTDH